MVENSTYVSFYTVEYIENGRFRLKPKSSFLTKSKKGDFDSTFPTEFSDWGIQSKNLTFSTGSVDLSVEKLKSKKFYTCFLNPSHRSSHHKTQTHTPIPGTTQQYHTTAPTLPWLSLLLLLAASQRGALVAPLASSVYHTTAAARVVDVILLTTATSAVELVTLG